MCTGSLPGDCGNVGLEWARPRLHVRGCMSWGIRPGGQWGCVLVTGHLRVGGGVVGGGGG